tara:strand:- start:249 stop:542 length:294 start_codon:yes stop_codon:yes gene_type:complete
MSKTITQAVGYLTKTFNDVNREASKFKFTMDEINAEKAKHDPASVQYNVLVLMENSAIVVDKPKQAKKKKESFDEIKEADELADYDEQRLDDTTDCV